MPWIALLRGRRPALGRQCRARGSAHGEKYKFITTVVFSRHYATLCCWNLCSPTNPYAIVQHKAPFVRGRAYVAVPGQKKRVKHDNLRQRGESDETSSDCIHGHRRGSG